MTDAASSVTTLTTTHIPTRATALVAALGVWLITPCAPLAAQSTQTAPLPSQAEQPAAPRSRHTHGAGTLELVLDGRRGTIDFTAAAQAVYGFEREPRTAAEREQRAKSLTTLRTRMGDAVILDSSLGCSVIASEVHAGNDSHGHATEDHTHAFRDDRNRLHVEVHGEYTLLCAKTVLGSTIRFGFTKMFPALRTLDVRVRAGTRDEVTRIEADRGEVRP